MRKVFRWRRNDGAEPYDNTDRHEVADAPDLVGSLGDDGLHYPVLDIDFPCHVRPSETPGHFHLFIDKGLEWEQYADLLEALAVAGIIEPGYANSSIERKGTFAALRPWKGR